LIDKNQFFIFENRPKIMKNGSQQPPSALNSGEAEPIFQNFMPFSVNKNGFISI
jgi:hypothetical protein